MRIRAEWSEVTVRGTERFRGEAWRQARLNGLAVRGYQATEAEQRVLVRTLGRRESAGASVVVDTEESRPPPAPDSHHQDAGQALVLHPFAQTLRRILLGVSSIMAVILTGTRPGRLPRILCGFRLVMVCGRSGGRILEACP